MEGVGRGEEEEEEEKRKQKYYAEQEYMRTHPEVVEEKERIRIEMMGNIKLNFGKYIGKTFGEVAKDKSYCGYICGVENPKYQFSILKGYLESVIEFNKKYRKT